MTAKKRWCLKSCEDFGNKIINSNNSDISWSSSSPENSNSPCKKKFKGEESISNLNLKGWTKVAQSSVSCAALNDNACDTTSNKNSVSTYSQFNYHTPRRENSHNFYYEKPISSKKPSPIISRLRVEKLSPVLTFTQPKFIHKFKISPIIGKNRIDRSARRILNENVIEDLKHKSKEVYQYAAQQFDTKSEDTSVGITPITRISKRHPSAENTVIDDSEETQSPYSTTEQQLETLIENDSPTSSQKTRVSILSEHSRSPLNYSIDPFPSPECSGRISSVNTTKTPDSGSSRNVTLNRGSPGTANSKSYEDISLLTSSLGTLSGKPSGEIGLITDFTETSSSSKSSGLEPLYHEVSPKTKRRYKKDGLADQLQKAVHKQKTDFAIWKHELYLKKSKGEKISNLLNETSVLSLKIIKFWKEFGVTILECEYANASNQEGERGAISAVTPKHLCDSVKNSNVNLKKCLVMVGFNVTHSIRIKINAKFKLCTPYITKIVKHDDEFKYCYFNVSKLLSFK